VKKILTYARNRKGITIVMIALMLFLLLALLGMAVDIAQVYFAKNQLQVAADAAALAGASQLDSPLTLTIETNVRNEAWKFACKNSASPPSASSPQGNTKNVFLADIGPTDCAAPPTNLNNSNLEDGDIVLGNWDPLLDPKFDHNRTPVNAVKIVASRTSGHAELGKKNGDNPVRVLIGRVFRFIGIDWSYLNVRATAIATMPPRASSFVAVGNEFCPLVGNLDCVGATGSIDPAICYLVTPREVDAKESSSPENQLGWTSLLNRPGSTSEFETLMCGTSPYQNVCSAAGIWGIPGTSGETFRNYQSLMCDPGFDAGSKEINPSGDVTGWEVIIPIVDRTDPMSAPDPNLVWGYAKVHIIEICETGTFGCRGRGSCISYGYCHGGDKKIVVDRISCISCADSEDMPGHKPVLVK